MSKEFGYVYYEGDCMPCFVNPFIGSEQDNNPSMAAFRQNPLKVIKFDTNLAHLNAKILTLI